MTEEWADKAACLGYGPELFYSYDATDQRSAREICMACPVKDECRDWALTVKEPDGIWGGMDGEERVTFLRQRRRKIRQDRIDQKRYERRTCEECGTVFVVTREQRVACSPECKRVRSLRLGALASRRSRYRVSA